MQSLMNRGSLRLKLRILNRNASHSFNSPNLPHMPCKGMQIYVSGIHLSSNSLWSETFVTSTTMHNSQLRSICKLQVGMSLQLHYYIHCAAGQISCPIIRWQLLTVIMSSNTR